MSENIKKLSEKEKVRKRISVWLGASNHIAVLHTIKEIVGNSADEINKGRGDEVEIIRHTDKKITIVDNCQGLPLEGKNEDGIENYKLLFETLFAGTKYENGVSNSDYTVGVNGVFNTVLAFSSQDVTFEVARPDGNVYSISYHKGDNSSPLQVIGKSDKTYTKITYELDDDIFEDNYFKLNELTEIASQQASLIKGKMKVQDEVTDQSFNYEYENGIVDFLQEETKDLNDLHDLIVFNRDITHETTQEGKTVKDDIKVSVAMKYTREDEGITQIEFLNGSNLIHHGTIYDGFVAGMRNIINRFLKDNNLYKKDEKQITKDDVVVGLNYVVNFKSYFPVYANQTKFASYVKYYEDVMKNALESYFESYIVEHKKDMELIAKQVLVTKQSRERAEKTRMDFKKKLSGTVNNITARVEGLVTCKSNDSTKTELYIVEGKSALGSTQQGRDPDIQAIYALRGKILNCLKAPYDKIFNNDIIVDLIKILGCGIEVKNKHAKDLNTFDLKNLRWSKVVICTDADVDGFHIRTLLLTMIHRLVPTLIEEGKVFIAESPLYEIQHKDDKGKEVSTFAYSNQEKDEILPKIAKMSSYTIQRSKGLGENTPEMMWDTTMNPETRRLIEVTPDDVEEVVSTFNLFLGDDLAGRKEYVEENLHEYIENVLD
ncbi:DNA topoisomerase [Bacillus phage vB_BanS_Sophrita]|uniref:DNA topoisomerase (ATP-hydrolyzing) n=1 Tax=Bacillus phage vB_BanS_Sophrita TaxID=2894790 RepID=A0AAE8YTW2_9CAUD|nr:DNA topoisomerase [Bacillus phage vB_BanS_Sophrita]UGO50728.1 DNA topoisomerase [Bacillus phage vB_BanS_Sophrita]